tara:strand:- start:728 stop:1633 length:906 start_codon:yes stop_codon:yes gene_type:complete
MRNLYFSDKVRSEQKLYEDIIIESLKIYGQDVYYIPRDLVQEDKIFGDDVPSRFNSAHKIEMYIENVEGFDGEGDLFTRFGVEIRDEATFVVSRNRWSQQVAKFDSGITSVRPLEGDLIYLPLSKKLFEISHVEHEQPFYQLSNLPVFKLRTRLFEYNNEDLDTGVTEVDKIELDYAYKYILTLDGTSGIITVGEKATQTLSSGVTISGEVAKWSDSDQKLHLIHVDTSDDKYHTFVTGTNITISAQSGSPTERIGDSAYNVTAIAEDNQLSSNEQNTDFSTGTDFIDFSESNPFGDVSSN